MSEKGCETYDFMDSKNKKNFRNPLPKPEKLESAFFVQSPRGKETGEQVYLVDGVHPESAGLLLWLKSRFVKAASDGGDGTLLRP